MTIIDSIRMLKPLARRPQMSYLTVSFTKAQVESMMMKPIHKREWSKACAHAKFPGLGKPVVPVSHYRCRATNQQLENFFDLFHEDDVLCRCSYGTKVFRCKEGIMEQHERVYTNKHASMLWQQYIEKHANKALLPFVSIDDIDEENEEHISEQISSNHSGSSCQRCQKTYKKGIQCRKDAHHSGRCSFTPASSFSQSIFRDLLKSFTAGHVKSLAGLDNEDVEKGQRNFQRLRDMVSRLCQLARTDNKPLMDMINEVEDFHRGSFIEHIKACAAADDGKKYRCCCLDCGFSDSIDEASTVCENILHHGGVCTSCSKSFSIFPLIDNLIQAVCQENETIQSHVLKDEISSFQYHSRNCRQNLIDYRAHLVLKFDEKEADKEELRNLQSHQAIVVCDWKMKILPLLPKETQQEYFAKRGTSMIGFMVIHYSPHVTDALAKKEVAFHFFLTDDTTQDNTSVLAAKKILYDKCLPLHVKEVLFRADGAGCFSSNLSKVAMAYWHKWSNIKEISNRQSPAGCGKTSLDGQFGVFQRTLCDRADQGTFTFLPGLLLFS